MSTAGKVLVVLVMLTVPVWVILVSGVAELNKSGGEQIANLKKQVEGLEKQVTETQKNIVKLKDQISLDQVRMGEQIAVTRSHQADLQKARSETLEIATRAKYQLDDMKQAVQSAEATRNLRTSEKSQEIKAKADAESEVAKLKQEHADLVDQLNKLRSDFKATVESNRKLVDRIKATRSS